MVALAGSPADRVTERCRSAGADRLGRTGRRRGLWRRRVDRGPVDLVRSDFFTRGSRADDALRIEGTPTRISTYGDFEVWGVRPQHRDDLGLLARSDRMAERWQSPGFGWSRPSRRPAAAKSWALATASQCRSSGRATSTCTSGETPRATPPRRCGRPPRDGRCGGGRSAGRHCR